jgi:hypothetical protein
VFHRGSTLPRDFFRSCEEHAPDWIRPGIDSPWEYARDVARDRDKLMILATDRRNRIQSNGRPRFDLTDEEIERSTGTAMRLADASKSQAEARAGANTTLPA